MKITRYILYLLLVILFMSSSSVRAAEQIEISADHLEFISESNMYIARGSVKLHFQDQFLYSDKLEFNAETYEANILGSVIYEDTDTKIQADKVKINLDTRIGTIYNGYIFYKKRNYHLKGGNIKKIGDKTFYIDRATLTTCDSDPPEWHISASDITIRQHKSLTSWYSAFRIKNFPVLYTPYFWAPIKKERQTGFLFPSFGYSSKRGHYYKNGFFWAIRENQDASLYLDYYAEKGWAEGLDYRYIKKPGTDGEFWIYHVRDDSPDRDLYEFKSYINHNLKGNTSGYLKLHIINNSDYYETMESTSHNRFGLSSWGIDPFGFASEERLQKYLESNLHVSKKIEGGRYYLLFQGRQSLEGSSEAIPQSFPEIAFILNTVSFKNISYNLSVKGNNFWREDGQKGQRIDINPNLFFSIGRLVTLTQKIGLRETSYILSKPSLTKHRFVADFGTSLSTKFYRKFSTLVHLIEPAIEYTFIPPVDNDNIPFFNGIDTISHTSDITYSLTNRISGMESRNLEARFRLSQSYTLLDVDNEFSPLLAEATLSSDTFDLTTNASYDVHESNFSETISSIRIKGRHGFIGFGKNFRRATQLDQYTFEFALYRPIIMFSKTLPIDLRGQLWYDAKGGGVQEMQLSSSYQHQCWGLSLQYNRQPDEYRIIVAVELSGLGKIKLGSI